MNWRNGGAVFPYLKIRDCQFKENKTAGFEPDGNHKSDFIRWHGNLYITPECYEIKAVSWNERPGAERGLQ